MDTRKLRIQAQQLINKRLLTAKQMAEQLECSKPTLLKLRTLDDSVSMDRVIDTINKLK